MWPALTSPVEDKAKACDREEIYSVYWENWTIESYIYLKKKQSCRSLVFSGTVHWFEGRQAFIHYCGLHQVWREPGN